MINGGGTKTKKKGNRRKTSRNLQYNKGYRNVETFSVSNIRPFKLIKNIVIVHGTEVTVPIVIFTEVTPAKIMTQERNSKEIKKFCFKSHKNSPKKKENLLNYVVPFFVYVFRFSCLRMVLYCPKHVVHLSRYYLTCNKPAVVVLISVYLNW